MKKLNKKTVLKILIYTLELLAILIVAYIFILPLYPSLKYKLLKKEVISETAGRTEAETKAVYKDETAVKEKTRRIVSGLPKNEYAVSPNRVIITKIGVNAPIVEAKSAEYGLSQGAWRVPESSTPDKGGNTVITGHRFKYLPPNNLTFYLLDKLETGDIISVIYKEKDYFYRVREIKIVEPTNLSIMDQTVEPILTLFTCNPIYSTDQRLVIVADLIENKTQTAVDKNEQSQSDE